MSEPGCRCFVALDPDADAAARLGRAIDPLTRVGADVRWVRPEHMHLTLQFLGDVPQARVDGLRGALRALDAGSALELAISGLGTFPPRGRPRVVWAGLRGDLGPLGELAAAIGRALVPLGQRIERRAFRPHLTLGRVRGPRGLDRLVDAIAELAPRLEVPIATVRSFRLYRSTLQPSGAVHEVLEEFPLSGGRS